MADKKTGATNQGGPGEGKANLGDEILNMLESRTKNPSEAFVLLQQLSVFLWAQFKIDWHDKPGSQVSDSRKQRYLDFVSGLIDQVPAEPEGSENNPDPEAG